eukprot:TRINITY_DN15709_c0_g1_i1.p1 TRINITY_DN15709_c0_g1~~TRINITY_DN15709_c0_g1_i1.p1  ORF type:complete len:237 (+),score=30.03 TRINITY_DN15709_c0_g1_i1:26-712(+)
MTDKLPDIGQASKWKLPRKCRNEHNEAAMGRSELRGGFKAFLESGGDDGMKGRKVFQERRSEEWVWKKRGVVEGAGVREDKKVGKRFGIEPEKSPREVDELIRRKRYVREPDSGETKGLFTKKRTVFLADGTPASRAAPLENTLKRSMGSKRHIPPPIPADPHHPPAHVPKFWISHSSSASKCDVEKIPVKYVEEYAETTGREEDIKAVGELPKVMCDESEWDFLKKK